jgi:hypothetical protein
MSHGSVCLSHGSVCLSALLKHNSHGAVHLSALLLCVYHDSVRLSALLLNICHDSVRLSALLLHICHDSVICVCPVTLYLPWFCVPLCPIVICPYVCHCSVSLSMHRLLRMFAVFLFVCLYSPVLSVCRFMVLWVCLSSVVGCYGYNRLIMEGNKICRSAHYPVKLDSPWGIDQGWGGSSAVGYAQQQRGDCGKCKPTADLCSENRKCTPIQQCSFC